MLRCLSTFRAHSHSHVQMRGPNTNNLIARCDFAAIPPRFSRVNSSIKSHRFSSKPTQSSPKTPITARDTTTSSQSIASSVKQELKYDAEWLKAQIPPPYQAGGYTFEWKWLTLGVTVLVFVAFGPEIKQGVSQHTADVASQSLRNEHLQIQTQELASDIIRTVLNDPKVHEQASCFLNDLMKNEQVQRGLAQLTKGVLNDAHTLAQVTKLAKQLLTNLIQDPYTLQQVVKLFKMAIEDPTTKKSLLDLIQALMKDEGTRMQLADLFTNLLGQQNVQDTVTSALMGSAHSILDSKDIQDHTKKFISDVVGDNTVQTQSGDALWNTIMYVVTPSWLKSSNSSKGEGNIDVSERGGEIEFTSKVATMDSSVVGSSPSISQCNENIKVEIDNQEVSDGRKTTIFSDFQSDKDVDDNESSNTRSEPEWNRNEAEDDDDAFGSYSPGFMYNSRPAV